MKNDEGVLAFCIFMGSRFGGNLNALSAKLIYGVECRMDG